MRRLIPLVLLLTCALAATARAAGPEIGIADDRILLNGAGPDADRAVAAWKAQGVDIVRIVVIWRNVAPGADALDPPEGFVAEDPDDFHYQWRRIDDAVNRVRFAGMKVMLTVTGPGPLWTSRSPSAGNFRSKPDAVKFAAFATAVAKRYGDRVDRYILWNEPNLSQWLQPQASCAKGRCTPVAPHLYRDIVRAAYPAIRAADPGAQVIVGALAPRGYDVRRNNDTPRPLAFLRAMGCVDAKFRRLRTGFCAGFQPATADGFSYHPHGVRNSPTTPFPNPDDVDLASLRHLEDTLDRLQRGGSLRATTPRMNLYLDEFGYQTNPPDRLLGVTPALQDAYLQQSAYIAWRDPRVRNLTQYVWIDEPISRDGSYSGWQSGLHFADGRAKPALAHFALPFFVDARRGRLWGQVRPGEGVQKVDVLRRLKGSTTWRRIDTVATDANGYWSKKARLSRGASYRFQWGASLSATMKA